MDTNKILTDAGYKGHPNYPAIAKFAASLGADTPERVLATVESKFGPPKPKLNLKSPVKYSIFGEDIIDPAAVEQMNLVMSMPPAIGGALLPDAHLGYAAPIGSVAVLENAVSPSLVGYDISCMMALSMLELTPQELEENIDYFTDSLRSVTSFGKGAESVVNHLNHPVMDSDKWNSSQLLKGLKDLAYSQIGSSGSGNHFADIVVVDIDGFLTVGLLTHSGSRGAGHKFAQYYMNVAQSHIDRYNHDIPNGYAWIERGNEAAEEYLIGMELMGEYALANHDIIHTAFAKRVGRRMTGYIWNRHNYLWETEDGYVHRKGATPAEAGRIGLIPGSSGTPSYIVVGLGNPDSIYSSSHGAGRVSSRTKAKENHDSAAHEIQMEGIHAYGVGLDESYQAYKDIDAVMEYQKDLVEVVGIMHPKVVVMGEGEEDI